MLHFVCLQIVLLVAIVQSTQGFTVKVQGSDVLALVSADLSLIPCEGLITSFVIVSEDVVVHQNSWSKNGDSGKYVPYHNRLSVDLQQMQHLNLQAPNPQCEDCKLHLAQDLGSWFWVAGFMDTAPKLDFWIRHIQHWRTLLHSGTYVHPAL